MISEPSCARLIEAVRNELRSVVLPAATDPQAQASLFMIDTVLEHVAMRCEREVAWMRLEIAEIETLASAVVAAGVDSDGRVAGAMADLETDRSAGDLIDDVRREYEAASEVLSRCVEATMPLGNELTATVIGVLEARLNRETEHQDGFMLVGRE